MKTDAIDVLALRKALNWTQEDLARYLGLDRSSISRMENGQPLSGPTKRLLDVLQKRVKHRTHDAA